MTDATDDWATVSRRELLGAGAVTALGSAGGCLQRVRSLAGRPAPEDVALTVKTPPADEDEPATRIARRLTDNLEAVGIAAELVLLREDELRRDVLVAGEFDLYVARMPLAPDPDFLRPRLHSLFVGEPGWQNPFGLTDIDLDEALAGQVALAGGSRRDRVDEIQSQVAKLQPFVPVAIPDEISAVRSDRFGDWPVGGLGSPAAYLSLSSRDTTAADRLGVATTDDLVTKNLNPLAVAYRERDTILGLLYEPLGRYLDGAVRPWLATDWTVEQSGDGTSVTVQLREGLTWHDGRTLSAADVGFTYRFLRDTTLGSAEATVPAPRYRGRTSLVESVTRLGERELRLELGDVTPAVGTRALTVPVLPAHIWQSRSGEAEIAGVGVSELVTEALVWSNTEPVGSGPLELENRISEETLLLARNEDHFLHGDGDPPVPAVAGGADFAELEVRVAPSTDAAVQLVAADEVDATAPTTDPSVAPRIAREAALTLTARRAPFLYHVGANTRLDLLGNPHVRRAIARLLDKGAIAADVFDEYAVPAASPLADTDWLAPGLAWEGTDPEVPFAGSDGELDVDRARDLFRDIGFQYREDRLLRR